MLRLFARTQDGTTQKVSWQTEENEPDFEPCELYERALSIEAADVLPIAFNEKADGSFGAAIYQNEVLYEFFGLNAKQRKYLEEFALFIRQAHATIRAVRLRSFVRISRLRVWKSLRFATGWEDLNPCEMEVFEELRVSMGKG